MALNNMITQKHVLACTKLAIFKISFNKAVSVEPDINGSMLDETFGYPKLRMYENRIKWLRKTGLSIVISFTIKQKNKESHTL